MNSETKMSANMEKMPDNPWNRIESPCYGFDSVLNTLKAKHLKVAIYSRVSAGNGVSEEESYDIPSIQRYKQLIGYNPNWTLAGIYQDKGIISDNPDSQKALNEMIRDCKAGKVDIVITKSIVRFSRNSKECLRVTDMLQKNDPPVGVLFEQECIYSMDAYGQNILLMLALIREDAIRAKSLDEDDFIW